LSESYVDLIVLGRTVTLPSPLRYSRSLYITYLDEDLLVVRDESGCPEILTRIESTVPLEEPSTEDEAIEGTGTAAAIEVEIDRSSTEDEGY